MYVVAAGADKKPQPGDRRRLRPRGRGRLPGRAVRRQAVRASSSRSCGADGRRQAARCEDGHVTGDVKCLDGPKVPVAPAVGSNLLTGTVGGRRCAPSSSATRPPPGAHARSPPVDRRRVPRRRRARTASAARSSSRRHGDALRAQARRQGAAASSRTPTARSPGEVTCKRRERAARSPGRRSIAPDARRVGAERHRTAPRRQSREFGHSAGGALHRHRRRHARRAPDGRGDRAASASRA